MFYGVQARTLVYDTSDTEFYHDKIHHNTFIFGHCVDVKDHINFSCGHLLKTSDAGCTVPKKLKVATAVVWYDARWHTALSIQFLQKLKVYA